MGNSGGSGKKSDEELAEYMTSMTLIRKEHSENLGKDIDLYRPNFAEFDEDLVLFIEITFEDADSGPQPSADFINRFKSEVNLRKNFNCRHISELLFVNYKVFSGLCIEKLMCRIALEYSEENLSHSITDSKGPRRSIKNPDLPAAFQVLYFLSSLTEALVCLKKNGRSHGFIKPENVLIYNKDSSKPLYKLLDVSLISRYGK